MCYRWQEVSKMWATNLPWQVASKWKACGRAMGSSAGKGTRTERSGWVSWIEDNIAFMDSWILKMGPVGFPETSIRNYHYSLHNIPEQHSSQHCHVAYWTKYKYCCSGDNIIMWYQYTFMQVTLVIYYFTTWEKGRQDFVDHSGD